MSCCGKVNMQLQCRRIWDQFKENTQLKTNVQWERAVVNESCYDAVLKCRFS